MDHKISVPYLSEATIIEAAELFLEKFNPKVIFPLEIEEIVEFDLGLDIIPILNLRKDIGVDGLISNNLKAVYVDLYYQENYYYRYRFTLAHEVGHVFLHEKIISNLLFKNIDEWYKLILANPLEYDKMDFQANLFAASVLVPLNLLEEDLLKLQSEVEEKIFEYRKYSKSINDNFIEYVISFISKELIPEYEVSSQVIERRIKTRSIIKIVNEWCK